MIARLIYGLIFVLTASLVWAQSGGFTPGTSGSGATPGVSYLAAANYGAM